MSPILFYLFAAMTLVFAIAVVANSQQLWMWAGLAVVVAIALVTLRGPGRTPLYGAIAIAAVDVTMLVLA